MITSPRHTPRSCEPPPGVSQSLPGFFIKRASLVGFQYSPPLIPTQHPPTPPRHPTALQQPPLVIFILDECSQVFSITQNTPHSLFRNPHIFRDLPHPALRYLPQVLNHQVKLHPKLLCRCLLASFDPVPIKNIIRQKTGPKRWQNHHS